MQVVAPPPPPDPEVAIPAKSELEIELQVKEKPEEKDQKKVTLSIMPYLSNPSITYDVQRPFRKLP